MRNTDKKLWRNENILWKTSNDSLCDCLPGIWLSADDGYQVLVNDLNTKKESTFTDVAPEIDDEGI